MHTLPPPWLHTRPDQCDPQTSTSGNVSSDTGCFNLLPPHTQKPLAAEITSVVTACCYMFALPNLFLSVSLLSVDLSLQTISSSPLGIASSTFYFSSQNQHVFSLLSHFGISVLIFIFFFLNKFYLYLLERQFVCLFVCL